MAAKHFAQAFEKKGLHVITRQIRAGNLPDMKKCDMLLLLFPVYALNAPKGVYQWLQKLPMSKDTWAAVISVSGGGEISPNTACRVGSIRRLENKGCNVYYENMLIMPSNFIYGYEHPLSELLVQVLPHKVSLMADDLYNKVMRRTRPLPIDRLLTTLCVPERLFAGLYGRFHTVGSTCNACGWCVRNCPADSIQMKDGKPTFLFRCQICMNCLYFCPKKAITPGLIKKIVLEEGYPINQWKDAKVDLENSQLDELTNGYAMSGVRAYLQSAKNACNDKGMLIVDSFLGSTCNT